MRFPSEPLRRRPHWSGDLAVTLSDGQTWYLPKIVPADDDGTPTVQGRRLPEILPLIVNFTEATERLTSGDFTCGWQEAMQAFRGAILLANYDLTVDEAMSLVAFRESERFVDQSFLDACDDRRFGPPARTSPRAIGHEGNPSLN